MRGRNRERLFEAEGRSEVRVNGLVENKGWWAQPTLLVVLAVMSGCGETGPVRAPVVGQVTVYMIEP